MEDVKTLLLARVCDEGVPQAHNFSIQTSRLDTQLIEEGAFLVRALAYSPDPYMRGGMRSARGAKDGQTVRGFLVGCVERSRNPAFKDGELVGASLPLSTLQIVTAAALLKAPMWHLPEEVRSDLSLGCGLLGMPGATAYAGLLDILRPQASETILVTAASGGVGALVCQLAKQRWGCRVIGTAGGPAKCAALAQLGCDVAIDYKALAGPGELEAALRAAAPTGIDMVFENVGGRTFEAAFKCLASGGRMAVCGAISDYNAGPDAPVTVSINPMAMIYTSQRIEGFVCSDWLAGKRGSFLADMTTWLREGWLKQTHTMFEGGLEAWPAAFQALMAGNHLGKVVVRA